MHVAVQTYAGYRGEERPLSFSLEGRILRIMAIVDRWYDPDHNIFKVFAYDGGFSPLRYDMNTDNWELAGSPGGCRTPQ